MLHVDRHPRKGYRRRVSIQLTVEKGPHAGVTRVEILRRIRAMIRLLQLEKAEVSFVLTDEKRLHELNKIYRGKDRPTDVLAFAMQEGEFGELAGHLLGDVIVSVPTARKQAAERRIPVVDEVTMLVAHGLLHLLGWDHDTAAKDRRMRAETARLVAAATGPSSPSPRAGTAARPASGAPSKGGADRALTRKPSRNRLRSRAGGSKKAQ